MLDQMMTLAGQSTLVLAVAGLMVALLWRGSAAQRHCVWTVGLGLLAVLLVWPSARWTWREERVAIAAPAPVVKARTRVVAEPRRVMWVELAQVIWLAGVSVLLSRVVVGQWKMEQLRRRAVWNEGGYWMSEEVQGPLVMGLWRPGVVLPVAAAEWDEERRRVVLLHEQMHVERRDLWWMVMGQVVAALFWMQPLVWWALREQRRESEQACDDRVVSAGVKASEYAEHLVAVATSLATEGGLEMARSNQLERRVKAMFSSKVSRAAVGKTSVAFAVLVGVALMAPVAGWKVVAQSEYRKTVLRGVVVDGAGTPVAGAKLYVQLLEKVGTRYRVRPTYWPIEFTNGGGEFRISSLPEGPYSIQVEKDGYARLEMAGIPAQSEALRFVLMRGEYSGTIGREEKAEFRSIAGSNVEGRTPPKILYREAPEMPADCLREKVGGVVVLRTRIGADGVVSWAEATGRYADARLIAPAIECVKKWRFEPARDQGVAVEAAATVEVMFRVGGLQ